RPGGLAVQGGAGGGRDATVDGGADEGVLEVERLGGVEDLAEGGRAWIARPAVGCQDAGLAQQLDAPGGPLRRQAREAGRRDERDVGAEDRRGPRQPVA